MAEITELQTKVMCFVKWWADNEKTIIPQREIIIHMEEDGTKGYITIDVIERLIKKGYIRKAYSPQQNRTFYVMLRTITEEQYGTSIYQTGD